MGDGRWGGFRRSEIGDRRWEIGLRGQRGDGGCWMGIFGDRRSEMGDRSEGGSGEVAVAGCWMGIFGDRRSQMGDRSAGGQCPMWARVTFYVRVIRLLPAAATGRQMRRRWQMGGDGRWGAGIGLCRPSGTRWNWRPLNPGLKAWASLVWKGAERPEIRGFCERRCLRIAPEKRIKLGA